MAHVELGVSIRALSRDAGCHPSTILRQVRRLETQRDDPLVDEALRALGRQARQGGSRSGKDAKEMTAETTGGDGQPITTALLLKEGVSVLRDLAFPGTVLALAADMERAVVVRDRVDGTPERLRVIDRALAQAMALKEWISCDNPGRVSRYRITRTGRGELSRMLARNENAARGFAEGMARFDMPAEVEEDLRGRGQPAESPLSALARRRDKDGTPFVTPDLVRAGERLREDFELARTGGRPAQNWQKFLQGTEPLDLPEGPLHGADAARKRVAAALRELGPGLGDVALRCCCHMEGLETTERSMGWSARSGKVVLRIALQRLQLHYASGPQDNGLIG